MEGALSPLHFLKTESCYFSDLCVTSVLHCVEQHCATVTFANYFFFCRRAHCNIIIFYDQQLLGIIMSLNEAVSLLFYSSPHISVGTTFLIRL